MDTRLLRRAYGQFATGVTVVTCRNDAGLPHGITVNAFTAVSLVPALVQVTISRDSNAARFLPRHPFAINILGDAHLEIARQFAGQTHDVRPCWSQGPTAPILNEAATILSCAPWRTYDGGDHLIILGHVSHVDIRDALPLLFYCGTFHKIGGADIAEGSRRSLPAHPRNSSESTAVHEKSEGQWL